MNQSRTVLAVDDEQGILEVCEDSLAKLSLARIQTAFCGQAALELLQERTFDLLLVDLKMPDMSGMEILRHVKKQHPETEVIIMTAFPTVEGAVEAVREGAFDYIVKPFTPDQLRFSARRALQKKELEEQNRLLSRQIEKEYRMGSMIGKSSAMQSIFDMVRKVAATNSEVLICGETGTGKELIARSLHQQSSRHKGKFVPVDCGAIPENLLESEFFGFEKGSFTGAEATTPGLLEFAHGGTFFLDEVCELPPMLQAKLLRVLQERTVRRLGSKEERKIDVRLIAATNRDIAQEIKNRHFRKDLFYRINVVCLEMPPLRNHLEDLPLLLTHFLSLYSRELRKNVSKVDEDSLEVFRRYPWPGNVRELQNVLKRAIIVCPGDKISMDDLPDELVLNHRNGNEDQEKGFFAERTNQLNQFEVNFLTDLLVKYAGDVTLIAKEANIPRGTLYRLLKKHKIAPDRFRK